MGLGETDPQAEVMRCLLHWHPQRLLHFYLLAVFFFVIIQIGLINLDLFELLPSFGPLDKSEGEGQSQRPIDAVYTWVNGSDPKFINSLHDVARTQLVAQLNETCDEWVCDQLLPVILIRPQLMQPDKYITSSVKSESFNQSATLIYFHDSKSAREFGSTCVRIYGNIIYKLTNLCLVGVISDQELKLESVVKLQNVSEVPKHAESDPLRYLTPSTRRHLTRLEVSTDEDHTGLVLYTTRHPATTNLTRLVALIKAKLNSSIHYRFDVVSPIYFRMTDKHFFLRPLQSDNIQSSRFADNDELKYSLRSLHKHAPWIRTVYLVTNGQIPHWLNLANPRVRVVSHNDIFPNQSHLPSFSSAAIESHLHRIANISDHFLYFNDDIILGRSIYPDDFYTESRGHKVYLSWPVPNCAEGCPLNWLHDGYCDKPCNSSQCLWDGGDCLASAPSANTSQNLDASSNEDETYHLCSSNCLRNWLGDSFCDQVCNNAHCGYDMADCGVRNFDTLHGIEAQPNNSLYYYSSQVNFLYFNLTQLMPKENEQLRLLGANYLNVSSIYSVVLNLKHQVLTVLLYPNVLREHLIFNFTASFGEKTFIFCLHLVPENNSSALRQETNCTSILEWNKFINQWNQTQQINNTIVDQMFNRREQWPRIVPLSTEFNELCKVNETELAQEMRQQWDQVQLHYEASLLTDTGRVEFYRQLRLLYTAHICNATSGGWDSFEHFARTHFTKQDWFRSRRLLDTYADSLVYVNYLYNQHFGVVMRKAPAHMAHYIDKRVMVRLQEQFPEEFGKTSAHRVRHSQDMQFAFSYFYFLMSETQQRDIMPILQDYDTDSSGHLNMNELRTLLSKLHEYPLKREHFDDFLTQMDLCCDNCTKRHEKIQLSLISMANCDTLRNMILERNGKSLVNRFEVVNSEDSVAFKMLRSNETLLEQELDELRRNRKKFICLNDNLEHTSNDTQERRIKTILQDFYKSLFPHKSPFEYVDHYENKYLYLDQYREWQHNTQAHKLAYLNVNYMFLVFNAVIFTVYCISRILSRYRYN